MRQLLPKEHNVRLHHTFAGGAAGNSPAHHVRLMEAGRANLNDQKHIYGPGGVSLTRSCWPSYFLRQTVQVAVANVP